MSNFTIIIFFINQNILVFNVIFSSMINKKYVLESFKSERDLCNLKLARPGPSSPFNDFKNWYWFLKAIQFTKYNVNE